MYNYHTFVSEGKPILFLTEFKQAFVILKEEYGYFKENDKTQIERILDRYSKYVTQQDYNSPVQEKDYLYELYLCVANDCNASCCYCFANQGNYGKPVGLMTIEMGRRAVDFFMNKVPDDCLSIINFFGGEPLLAYDIIVEICEYVKENYNHRKYEFHITTNATLLSHDMIDYFVNNHFKIAISIDGDEKIHNKQRPLKNGKNSYIEATKNLKYLVERNASILARGTYMDFDYSLPECYEALISLGFSEVNIVPDLIDVSDDRQLKKLLIQLDALYEYVLEYMCKNQKFPFGLLRRQIRQLFVPQTELLESCGAGKTIYAIDVNGDIFPCHRYSGILNTRLGNVLEENKKMNGSKYVYMNYKCNKCWNRHTCGHGCHYEIVQGNVNANLKNTFYCVYAKKMTELAIRLCMHMSENQLMDIMMHQQKGQQNDKIL